MWKIILGWTLAAVAAQAPASPGVADPSAFLRGRYAEYERGGPLTSLALDTYASERLRSRLHAFDEAAGGQEVDSLDWWVDGVDWAVGRVALTREAAPDAARQTVVARFRNHGRPVRLRFLFVRERGAWYLDEVVKPGRGGWTLTGRLAMRPAAGRRRAGTEARHPAF